MSTATEFAHSKQGVRAALRAFARRLGYACAGVGITLLLFSAGPLLGDASFDMPGLAGVKPVPIADVPVPEPEEEVFEMMPDPEMELPRIEMEMTPLSEIAPPRIDMELAVNPSLNLDVAVPAAPVMQIAAQPAVVPAPPAAAAPSPPMAADMGSQVFGAFQLETAPRLVHAPPPAYPRDAMRSNIQGVVRVAVVLERDGGIVSTRLMPGPHTDVFGQATLEAVRRWRFTPGKIGDKPVMCEVEIPVEFNLASGGTGGDKRSGGGRSGAGGGFGGSGMLDRRRR